MAEGRSPFLNPHEPGYGGGPLYSDQDGAVMVEHGENGARRVRLDFNVLRRQNVMPNGTNSIRLIFARGQGGEERLALGFRRVDGIPPSTPTVVVTEPDAPIAGSSEVQQEPQPGPSTGPGNGGPQKRKSSEGVGVNSPVKKADVNDGMVPQEEQPVQANNDMMKQLGEMYSVMSGMLCQLDTLNKKTEGLERATVGAKQIVEENAAKPTPSSGTSASAAKENAIQPQPKPKMEETFVQPKAKEGQTVFYQVKLKEAVVQPKSDIGGTVKQLKSKVETTAAQPRESSAQAPVLPAKPAKFCLYQIYSENRKKARMSHLAFQKLAPRHGAPLYTQPCDTIVYHKNNASYADFKPKLQKYLRNKMQEKQRIRDQCSVGENEQNSTKGSVGQ